MHIIKNSITFDGKAYIAGQEAELIAAVKAGDSHEKPIPGSPPGTLGTFFDWQYFLDLELIDELPDLDDEERPAKVAKVAAPPAKPLERQSLADLRQTYADELGAAPDDGETRKSLIAAISAKRAE